MVPLNLYQYRNEIKQALLARKAAIDQEWDPFVASWLAYAFISESNSQSLPLREISQRLNIWANDETVWEVRRNVGPLFFLIWLQMQLGYSIDDAHAQKAKELLGKLRIDDKLSPLRQPEQVFLIALGISALKQDIADNFISVISSQFRQLRGTLARQILFIAAIKELGGQYTLPSLKLADVTDITDIIAVLWWAERYSEGYEKSECWSKFTSIKDNILLYRAEEFDTRYILSEWELAILYEAIVRETSIPDPMMLFDYYPLHPRVRQIAEEDFKKGNYFGAVFEACKALEDFLRTISGSTNVGVRLVDEVLGRPDMTSQRFTQPRVSINPLDQNSVDFITQLNEQTGFSHLAYGIFQAFRNPKGHQPKDKDWLGIDAYEALDELVVISLVMKRIEAAIKSKP